MADAVVGGGGGADVAAAAVVAIVGGGALCISVVLVAVAVAVASSAGWVRGSVASRFLTTKYTHIDRTTHGPGVQLIFCRFPSFSGLGCVRAAWLACLAGLRVCPSRWRSTCTVR